MQIVIDMPEGTFESVKRYYEHNQEECYALCAYVANGTPLPKGHGKLIDADVLCDYFWDNRSKLYTHKDLQIVIDDAQTIIEADKAESEDTE